MVTWKADADPELLEQANELLRTAAAAGNLYGEADAPAVPNLDAFRRQFADLILELTRKGDGAKGVEERP